MYYFIAIVLDADILNGSFSPAYVLCKSYTTNEKRSGWRIISQVDGRPTSMLPRVLVTETIGHQDMVDFMSSYQKKGADGKHFHPRGALCWFSCNRYGDPTGETVFIKRVPDFIWIFDFENRGFQKLKRDRAQRKTYKELLVSEPNAEVMKFSDKKAKLHQNSHAADLREFRKEKRNGRKKDGRKGDRKDDAG